MTILTPSDVEQIIEQCCRGGKELGVYEFYLKMIALTEKKIKEKLDAE